MAKVKKVAAVVADIAAFLVTPQGKRDIALVVAAIGGAIKIAQTAGVF